MRLRTCTLSAFTLGAVLLLGVLRGPGRPSRAGRDHDHAALSCFSSAAKGAITLEDPIHIGAAPSCQCA
jgi:hypothetical protein